MHFGSGTKHKVWKINKTKNLMATWSYFHIFFFPIAFNIRWHIIGDSLAIEKTISYEEVKRLIPINTPEISLWNRYGLLFGICILVTIGYYHR